MEQSVVRLFRLIMTTEEREEIERIIADNPEHRDLIVTALGYDRLDFEPIPFPSAPFIKPQPGPQTQFYNCAADICIYGGAAGSGKSASLVFEPLKHIGNSEFGCVVFRRTYAQIANEGSIWDEARVWYPRAGGVEYTSEMSWKFPSGATISFRHCQHEKDIDDYMSAQIALLIIDQVEQFCLHPETEVLTESGWRLIGHVQPGNKVASLTKDQRIVYSKVADSWKTPCASGKLYSLFQRNGISFRATANHRLVVAEHMIDLSRGWKFKKVSEIKYRRVLRTGDYQSGKERTTYFFREAKGRGLGTNANSASSCDMDNWLEFLGWWFAEGGCYIARSRPGALWRQSQSPQVNLRQTGRYKKDLRKCLKKLPFRFYENKKTGMFIISSRQLYDEMSPLGDTYSKRIPRWIFKLSKRQIRLFFDAFLLGDGSACKTNNQIGLANEGLVDDLQEMAFLLGMVATKGYSKVATKAGIECDVWRLSVTQHDFENLGTRRRDACWINRDQFLEEDYDGYVHCLSVPETETFLVRHRGRYWWSGNSAKQFWGLIGRNRSGCGIRPYTRCACNPSPGSWIADLLEWWIDQDTGYPILERSGVVRYLTRIDDKIEWADSKQDLIDSFPDHNLKNADILSFTFIPAKVDDNQILLERDPGYVAKLKALPYSERMQLLHGNWRITIGDGLFKTEMIEIIDVMPANCTRVRYWDKANTTSKRKSDKPCYTVGALLSRSGRWFIIEDIVCLLLKSEQRNKVILRTCQIDAEEYGYVPQWLEQEPGPLWEEEKVQLGNGLQIALKDVKPGDTIIDQSGQSKDVSDVHIQGDLECLRLHLDTGRTIVVAHNHPFKTPHGWTEAGKLTVGDSLALRAHIEIDVDSFPRPEECRMAGYFVGDGCCTINNRDKRRPNGCLNANIACSDDLEGEDIIHCAKMMGWNVSSRCRTGHGSKIYHISNGVREWLRERELAGKRTENKVVPDWIWKADNKSVAHFIGAFFACDGCISFNKDYPAIEFYNSNLPLLEQIRSLLLRFGIFGRIRTRKKPTEKQLLSKTSGQKMHRITLRKGDDSCGLFAESIPVFGIKGVKLQHLKKTTFDRPFIADPIIAIEPAGKLPCRCLTVKYGESFLVNDVVVHNSGGKESSEISVQELAGFDVRIDKPQSEDKLERAMPFAAQVEAGNVRMKRAHWNKMLIDAMMIAPNGPMRDLWDALSGAFNKMALHGGGTGGMQIIYAPESSDGILSTIPDDAFR